jgi:magnesium transporter
MVTSQKEAQKKQVNLKTLTVGDLTWVDIVQPTKDTADYLAQQYNFHPMDLEDALSARQLSKIEEYPQYLFAVLHFQVYEKMTRISTRRQWSTFIGDKFLITMHPSELKAIDDIFRECELSADIRQEYLGRGSGFLLYQILDRLLDSYFPVLDKIAGLLSNIEDNVFNEQIEAAEELCILRRDIITQRQVIFPTRTLLMELEGKIKRFAKIDLSAYFSDLMDHINKVCDMLNENTEVIEVFKDADYILSSYRANRGIRSISIMLAIGLALLTVFGLYGMYNMLKSGNIPTFFVLLAAVVVIVTGILYVFRRRRLI